MDPTFLSASVAQCGVCVHMEADPSEQEWERYLHGVRDHGGSVRAKLVVSLGGSPSQYQMRRAIDAWVLARSAPPTFNVVFSALPNAKCTDGARRAGGLAVYDGLDTAIGALGDRSGQVLATVDRLVAELGRRSGRPLTLWTDAELFESYSFGLQRPFEELHRRYAPRVLGMLARTCPQAVAVDLTQETFLRFHQYRSHYDPKRPMIAWLYTIAGNLRRTHRRARQMESVSPDALDGVAGRELAPDEAVAVQRDLRAVQRAIMLLSPRLREALATHAAERGDYAAVATRLGLSRAAARVRVHRARAAIAAETGYAR